MTGTRTRLELREVEVCNRCDQEHVDWAGRPGCTAHSSREHPGEPCRKTRIRGGFVCPTHGGRTPQVVAAAAARLARVEALALSPIRPGTRGAADIEQARRLARRRGGGAGFRGRPASDPTDHQ